MNHTVEADSENYTFDLGYRQQHGLDIMWGFMVIGKWYASGTPAGYTLKAVEGGSYTLTTSKGPCAVDGTTKLFSCGAEVTKGSEFVFVSPTFVRKVQSWERDIR